MKLLLDFPEIDVNVGDDRGETPLHWACYHGKYAVAQLLLDKGADASACTERGNTPLDLADARGHTQVAQLLRDYPRSSP